MSVAQRRSGRLFARATCLAAIGLTVAGFTIPEPGPGGAVQAQTEAPVTPSLPETTPDVGAMPSTEPDPAELPPEEVPEAAQGASGVEAIEPDALPEELGDAMTGRKCSAWDASSPALEGSFRADLGGSVKLWAIVCDSAAYNTSYGLFLDREEGASYEPLLFADYAEAAGWMGTDRLFNISFEAGGLILTSLYKGRGPGDCGTAGTWVWDGETFRLDMFRAKEECDGGGGAETFPVVFSRDGEK